MSDSADYFTLFVSNLTQDEADVLSALVFEHGAQGTEEILDFIQRGREYEPETVVRERTAIKIYFLSAPSLELLEELKSQFAEAQFSVAGEKNRDWMAEWKKSFQPFCLAGDAWVVPSWCETPSAAKKIIRIDPGMAFGTGTHETTRLAASFIADYANEMKSVAGANAASASLFDVGTGTGILAMLAEHYGFSDLGGNDNDLEACRVARENVELNQSRVKIVEDDIADIAGPFDVVVANIIDGVLVKLQKDLKRCVREAKTASTGGYLLLTGILHEREALFRSEFSFENFREVERRQLGEWVGILLKRM